jgi:hypothetical protein
MGDNMVVLVYIVCNINKELPVVVANAINTEYFRQKGLLSTTRKKLVRMIEKCV